MATTLRALVAGSELRLRLVVADAGSLDRPVRWAHTTELLDPRPHLGVQGLVCTVGLSLVDAESCRHFAAAVLDVGAAGICFGVGDVHEVVPPDLVEACRGRLPLVAPLLAADRQHGGNQLATLRAFLRLDDSLQATARNQFLHVDTVRHRLDRIHRVVGRDPLVFADRTAPAIALWAFDRQQDRSAAELDHPGLPGVG